MKNEIKVLLVEDSPDDAVFVINELEKSGLIVQHKRVDTARDMKTALTEERWDIILLDYSIPGFGAVPALSLLKEMKIDLPVIIISGVIGEDIAVGAMKAGAHDFIIKGSYARLVPAVRREVDEYIERKAHETEAAAQKHEAEKQRQLAFTMVMQNPQPLLIVDKKFNIKLANEAFIALSGLTEEKLQHMTIRDFKILSKTGHNIREALETKKGVTGEVVVQFSTATYDLEQHTIPLLDKEGEIVSIMTVYNDLTDKKREDAEREELSGYTTTYLSSMADNLAKLAKGDLNFNMEIAKASKNTEEARQRFTGINSNLGEVKKALSLLISDANMLSKAAVEGKLDARADPSKHHGDFRIVVEGVNSTLDSVIGPLNVAAEYMDRISKGDIPPKITDTYSGDFNEIKNNLNQAIDVMTGLLAETDTLIKATKDGKLQTRGDAKKFAGGWGTLVGGVNELIDAFVAPINVTADYVDKISKGEIPAKITDTYNGDFNLIKNNLNNCIDGLGGLVEANVVLQKMSVNDYTWKVMGSYQGIYADVGKAVNTTEERIRHIQDTVDHISVGDLHDLVEYKKVGRRSEGDKLMPGFIHMMEAIQLMIQDANMLSEAAVAGRLATRADASKHQGDFRKIVDGVNQTLDAVIDPVNEAMRVSNEYAKQNFGARVDENLKVSGDFIQFKKSLNNVGIQVSQAMIKVNEQVNDLAAGAQEASASVEEVSAGSNQIAKNAGAVSVNADKSSEGMKQVIRAMEDLSSTVQEVASKADKVAQIAKKSEELSQKGMDLANKADKGMGGITKSSSEVNVIILDIKSQMDKIGDIVVLIAKLANQTNLLALNAAIEAARAGEAGRGFAVVAREVKSLAIESENSAEKIRQMIGELQKQTQRAVDAVEKANDGVRDGSGALTQTLEVFNKIVESINEINKNISDVAASAEEQAASVEEVTASVTTVSELINDTSKEATDAAAASEESSAAIDQISKVVQNVTTIVDQVTREISAFRTAEENTGVRAKAKDYNPSTARAS